MDKKAVCGSFFLAIWPGISITKRTARRAASISCGWSFPGSDSFAPTRACSTNRTTSRWCSCPFRIRSRTTGTRRCSNAGKRWSRRNGFRLPVFLRWEKKRFKKSTVPTGTDRHDRHAVPHNKTHPLRSCFRTAAGVFCYTSTDAYRDSSSARRHATRCSGATSRSVGHCCLHCSAA